jgi:hypothetical protein
MATGNFAEVQAAGRDLFSREMTHFLFFLSCRATQSAPISTNHVQQSCTNFLAEGGDVDGHHHPDLFFVWGPRLGVGKHHTIKEKTRTRSRPLFKKKEEKNAKAWTKNSELPIS